MTPTEELLGELAEALVVGAARTGSYGSTTLAREILPTVLAYGERRAREALEGAVWLATVHDGQRLIHELQARADAAGSPT